MSTIVSIGNPSIESHKVAILVQSNEVISRQIKANKVCAALQKMQLELVEKIDESIAEFVGEVSEEQPTELKSKQESNCDGNNLKNHTKSDKPGCLPIKLFKPRNSPLTDLFANNHGRAVYNIFVVFLIILFLNTAIDDIVAGKLNLGLKIIQLAFGGLLNGILIWLCMTLSTFALYGMYSIWANYRVKLPFESWIRKIWDVCWVIALVVNYVCFLYFPAWSVVRLRLALATKLAVLAEQIRMIMKSYAFIRSNIHRAVPCKEDNTENISPCPAFSLFAYFFFCPTLVYQDSYPRTDNIRWKFVVTNIYEMGGLIFYASFLIERYIIPSHENFGKKQVTHEERIALVFGSILPCTMMLMCGTYLLLHCWLNAAAEVLRFADRMFYQDWWNAKSYGSHHRRWNVVIHDWLYTYIYKDVCELFCKGGRLIPTLAVFIISAIVHEYILVFFLGFFFPVLLVVFGVMGVVLTLLMSDQTKGGNLFVLLSQIIGIGLLSSMYCMEWFARINCVQTRSDLEDLFVPRSWECIPTEAVSMTSDEG